MSGITQRYSAHQAARQLGAKKIARSLKVGFYARMFDHLDRLCANHQHVDRGAIRSRRAGNNDPFQRIREQAAGGDNRLLLIMARQSA